MDEVDFERWKEEHQDAVRVLCWRFLDLASSRKTGAIKDLAVFVAGEPEQSRRSWSTAVKFWIKNTLG